MIVQFSGMIVQTSNPWNLAWLREEIVKLLGIEIQEENGKLNETRKLKKTSKHLLSKCYLLLGTWGASE